MRNWIEKIRGLSLSTLFTQGHLLPSEQVPAASTGERRVRVSVARECIEACRTIVQRPRLIQPH